MGRYSFEDAVPPDHWSVPDWCDLLTFLFKKRYINHKRGIGLYRAMWERCGTSEA